MNIGARKRLCNLLCFTWICW